MTYFRVSLGGPLGASGEVWSVNPCFNSSIILDVNQSELQAAANAVAAVAAPTSWKQLITTQAKIATVRVEQRADNHSLEAVAEAAYTGWGTGTFVASMPPQTAVVLSLRSDVPSGRGRGRLYLPAMGGSISASTYRLTSPVLQTLANDSATFLRGIQDAIKSGVNPAPAVGTIQLCVVSKTAGSRVDINRIQVGDVVDTQRRRRDRLAEAYVSAPFPGA